MPDFIEMRDALPVTVTGKLMRRELKQIAAIARHRGASIVTREAWHRWGAEDERGALNHIDPVQVRDAAALVRSGQVLSLAQPLSPRTPVPQHRAGVQHFMGRDGGDYAAGARRPGGFQFAEDTVVLPLHIGTHIDALCHAWYDDASTTAFPALAREAPAARRVAVSTRWGRSWGVACCSMLLRLHGAPLRDGAAIGRARSGARGERR